MTNNTTNNTLNEYLTTAARSVIVSIGLGFAYFAYQRTPAEKPPLFPELPTIVKNVDVSDVLTRELADLSVHLSQIDYKTELGLRFGRVLRQLEDKELSKEAVDTLLKETEDTWKSILKYNAFFINEANNLRLELEFDRNKASRANTKRSITKISELLVESNMLLYYLEVMRVAFREANGEQVLTDKNNRSLHIAEERTNDAHIRLLLKVAADLHLKMEVRGELGKLVNNKLNGANPADEESLGMQATKLQERAEKSETAFGGIPYPKIGEVVVWLSDTKMIAFSITTKTNHEVMMAALELYRDTHQKVQSENAPSR